MTASATGNSMDGDIGTRRGSSSMAFHIDRGTVAQRSDRRSRQLEYRLLVLIVFPFFLLFAVLARLVPWRATASSSSTRPSRRRSVLSEAREASHTVIPFVFMG